MPAPRRLKIFRLKDGVRIPYVIELDHELTVIHEYADTTAIDHAREGRAPRRQRDDDPQKEMLRTMSRWVTQSIQDNPIPGTDELRQSYVDDLNELTGDYSKVGKECPTCDISQLIRRYRDKLESGGYFDHPEL
jgi:hypothetical protein